MKQSLLIIMTMFSSTLQLQAQKDSIGIARNTLFIEFLGNGGLYSFNYDRMLLSGSKASITSRIGFSYMPYFSVVGIPFEFNILVGKRNHFFNVGLGFSYLYGMNSCDQANCGNDAYTSSTIVFAARPIGYRFRKKEGGFFLSTGLIPVWRVHEFNENFKKSFDFDNSSFYIWAGLGIGYTLTTNRE